MNIPSSAADSTLLARGPRPAAERGPALQAAEPPAPAPSKIERIWYTRSPVPTPLGLAAQLGWFLDEFRDDGIGVFTVQEAESRRIQSSHRDHHLQHSFRQGGNMHALWARARGRQTRVIGLNWLDEYQAVLAVPGRGIRKPADLRGRRLGVPANVARPEGDSARAAALRGLHAALEIGGIGADQAEFVDIPIACAAPPAPGPVAADSADGYHEQAAALHNGHVDAIFVKGAHGAKRAFQLKAHPVLDLRAHPDPLVRANHGVPRPITVDLALLEARPDIVARFLARILAVQAWAEAHPQETLAYVVRETQAAEHWVRLAYGEDLHLHQRTDFDPTSIAALAAYKRFLLERGLIGPDFDLDGWLDPAPLQEASRLLARGGVRG